MAGNARFADQGGEPPLEVTLNGGGTQAIDAAHYLMATGAAPRIPPISGLAAAGYLTSATAMALTELPGSMLVIGGNAVGLELAQLFTRLGTRVTIAEARDRLAPFDEPEVSAVIEDVFDDGASPPSPPRPSRRCGATPPAVRSLLGRQRARSRERAYAQVLVAAGRRPVTAGLNLEAVRGAGRRARRDRHR